MKNIDKKTLLELSKLFGLYDEENQSESLNKTSEYLSNLNNDKFLEITDILKNRTNMSEEIKYLSDIVNYSGYQINDELALILLEDKELSDFVLNASNSNKFTSELKKRIGSEEADVMALEDDLFDEEEKPEESENNIETSENVVVDNSEDSDTYEFDSVYAALPKNKDVYKEDEEKIVFTEYTKLQNKLKKYLYDHKCIDFVRYVKTLDDNTRGRGTKTKFDMNNALEKLFGICNEECVLELKQDKEFMKIIDNLRELRDEIASHNYRLVISIARKYEYHGLPLKDLIQEGNAGLLKAINKFDVARGNKFSTYAENWIKQGITRSIANEGATIRIPAHLLERRMKVRKIMKTIALEDNIEEPTDEQIYEKCKELGEKYSLTQIKELSRVENLFKKASLDKKVGEDGDSSLIEFLSDDKINSTNYAEISDGIERKEMYLKYIAEGKTITGKPIKNTSKDKTLFKKISFLTIDNEVISILLTMKEYISDIKGIKSEGGRERFINLLIRYGINPETLTSQYEITNFELTCHEKEVLIYRLRTGFHNEFSERFIELRNRNNALFEYEGEEVLTLEKTGKLLGVTRERIRQIQSKVERKMDDTKRQVKDSKDQIIYIGDKCSNIYDLFNTTNIIDWILTVPKNDCITLDDDYNITPVKTGSVKITIKSTKTGYVRELNITVMDNPKNTIRDFISRRKVLGLNKKDNQF